MSEQLSVVKEIPSLSKRKATWKYHFQKYCNSEEIVKESELNGINACGYGIQCDFCNDITKKNACANAMIEYCESKGIKIDFQDIDKSSFRKLLKP